MSEQVDTPQEQPPKQTVTPNETKAKNEPKQLSNKELKELKKKEKLEKRAAKKEAAGIPNQSEAKEQKAKQKAQQHVQQQQHLQNAQHTQQQSKLIEKTVPLFSHLETKEQRNELSLSQSQVTNLIHPTILSLTLKHSSYSIVGSIQRCKSMLISFKRVIKEYKTPPNTTLTRNLTNYLSNQIDYLKTARPLSVTMGNAIRWLKQQISLISIDVSDSDAKSLLIDKIDVFIKEKIELSDEVIIQSASPHITNGSTILTYGSSTVLKEFFLYNHTVLQKKFTLIIVDSRPLFEGKQMAEFLISKGLKIQYVLINSLTSILQDHIDTVFLGAHAMLSNGFLYSRVGTALIAMSAKNKNIPVLVCCESIKFTDRVQLDSVTLNELGDNEDLINFNNLEHSHKNGVSLNKFIKNHEEPIKINGNKKDKIEIKDKSPLSDWKSNPNLNILNIMYDLTSPEYIQKIITEVGALPPSSVPVILREYKSS